MTTPTNIPYLGPNPGMPGLYDLSQNKNLAHEQVMYLSGHLSGQMQGGLPLHPSYVTPGVQQQIPLRQGPQAQVGQFNYFLLPDNLICFVKKKGFEE